MSPTGDQSSYRSTSLIHRDQQPSLPVISLSPQEVEARCYYYGLSVQGKPGPRLLYRTSTDHFAPPVGPRFELKSIRLTTVHNIRGLSGDAWDSISQDVGDLLNAESIEWTAIELFRFAREESSSGSSLPTAVTSKPTVWIAVRPNTTSSDAVRLGLLSQKVLALLAGHTLEDMDVAIRESETHTLDGPELMEPVYTGDKRMSLVDRVTNSLGLSLYSPDTDCQGTLGCYFWSGDDVYGITARHVFFDEREKDEYHHGSAQKDVLLMSDSAFEQYCDTIQAEVGDQVDSITVYNRQIIACEEQVAAGTRMMEDVCGPVEKMQLEINELQRAIGSLKEFYLQVTSMWKTREDRVIGHVFWSPPIASVVVAKGGAGDEIGAEDGGGTDRATASRRPAQLTRDVCILKFNKAKLGREVGNFLDLGSEMSLAQMCTRLNQRTGSLPPFIFPSDRRLLALEGILPDTHIEHPRSLDRARSSVEYVLKRGHATQTTLGRANGYRSYVRRYTGSGIFQSHELAVISDSAGPFSNGGDSGALIATPQGEFAALLTGGGGMSDDKLDVTYGTPFHWLWHEVVKTQFPDASLDFSLFGK